MQNFRAYLLFLAIIFISCDSNKTAEIWTDRPEFSLYGNYFNTVQNQYKVSVKFVGSTSAELSANGGNSSPDVVAASWLKSSSMGTMYRSLDNLLGAKKISDDTFYPNLLAIGRIDKTQYLLPVSFNIPALVFSKDRETEQRGFALSNQFTIDFKEIKDLSRPYNLRSRGTLIRMGFSPLWDDNFLFSAAVLTGASFREATPLAWDSAALERSMVFINEWTKEINSSVQVDDDFTYKYFIEPPERLLKSGRILFSYMESDFLFILSEDSKNNLDFRWIMEKNQIPVAEDAVYIGIPKKAKAVQAARAFIQWFYKIENQRSLLEYSRRYRINENNFGICNGFSALTPVTEQIYPLFYPELLGRMPPSENFILQNILPENWVAIKERVILPYLHERARKDTAEEANPLEKRLSDWMRLNR
ncbi:MAG: extracellular solute-binding protein [Treponema sp.]|nr:extracellular solute-binding protein [Treponema sp.]